MDDCRSEGSDSGEPAKFAAARAATSKHYSPGADRRDPREDDVIRGLRRGLAFSLAIWAVLLTVGALVFS